MRGVNWEVVDDLSVVIVAALAMSAIPCCARTGSK